MISAAEIASLRAAATAALSGVCNVRRLVRTRQPNGSWKDVPTDVYTAVPCMMVPTGQTPQEQAIMQREATRGFSTFKLEGIRNVFSNDTIVYEGKEYPVAGVHNRTDNLYERVIVYDDSKAPAAAP